MKLLEALNQLILESRVLDYFETLDHRFYVFNTGHSLDSVGTNTLQRVDQSDILDSMSDIKELIAKNALIVLDGCVGNGCALLVRDNRLGFDYQMWLKKRQENKVDIVLNTSIHHPKKLFNQRRNKMLIIDYDGNQVMYENLESVKIKNLIIQFGIL
jgi:hypothetical protein